MTDWLAGSLLTLTYWPTDWLTVLLADDWLAGWMTDWHSEWLTYWLTDWLTIWLASWLTDWPIDWLTDQLSEWWQMAFLRRSWVDQLIVADLGCGQAGLLTIESHGVSSHCFPTMKWLKNWLLVPMYQSWLNDWWRLTCMGQSKNIILIS